MLTFMDMRAPALFATTVIAAAACKDPTATEYLSSYTAGAWLAETNQSHIQALKNGHVPRVYRPQPHQNPTFAFFFFLV